MRSLPYPRRNGPLGSATTFSLVNRGNITTGPVSFVQTNVVGTPFVLLACSPGGLPPGLSITCTVDRGRFADSGSSADVVFTASPGGSVTVHVSD